MNQAIDFEPIDALLGSKPSAIARDLKLNLRRLLGEEGKLDPQESLPALLALAASVGHAPLESYARKELSGRDFTSEQIEEAAESAAIMAMLNTYYRFRHMIAKEASEDVYRTAGLRMTGLARPVLGRERFEMLAFAVSVLNGCESCIRSHEAVLREAGVSVDKIHDLARLAAVVRGLRALENRGE